MFNLTLKNQKNMQEAKWVEYKLYYFFLINFLIPFIINSIIDP